MRRLINIMSALLLAASLITITSCKKDDPAPAIQVVTVGGLLSLNGNWSSLGITSMAAMEIAAQRVNAHLEETGSRYRINYRIYDTHLDTSMAKEYIQIAGSAGIRFLIGPQSSAEAAAVLPYANNKGMLIVSQGSTAGSLALAGDNLYRFCPPDKLEGSALAGTIYNQGIRGLVTISRDDAGNKGLQAAVGNTFAGLGGTVESIGPYPTSITDFSSLMISVRTRIQSLAATHGISNVGVYLASFDEGVLLMNQASGDTVLSSVNWYGGDGIVLSNALITDTVAAGFAISTNFFAPTFGLPASPHPDLQAVTDEIKSMTSLNPDAFALAAYDAMWTIALTVASFPELPADISSISNAFTIQANKYFGITGPTFLDAYGDRSSGSFDYYGIVKEDGKYLWKFISKTTL